MTAPHDKVVKCWTLEHKGADPRLPICCSLREIPLVSALTADFSQEVNMGGEVQRGYGRDRETYGQERNPCLKQVPACPFRVREGLRGADEVLGEFVDCERCKDNNEDQEGPRSWYLLPTRCRLLFPTVWERKCFKELGNLNHAGS